MKDILNWLEGVEQSAADLYRKASEIFSCDSRFSAFLNLLAEEELEHQRLINTAVELMEGKTEQESGIIVDEKIRAKVEAPLEKAKAGLDAGTMTKAAMMESVVEAEFSEWNDIFLYAMETLKGEGRQFQAAASEIVQHRKEIAVFLGRFPEAPQNLEQLLQPRIWTTRYLVVEDDPAIGRLLKGLLARQGEVVIANDGEAGLALLCQEHFDVVISDIDMPRLNGIELYLRALEVDTELKNRFIFFTGTENADHLEFCKTTGVTCLRKPSPLTKIRGAVSAVTEKKLAIN